MLNETTQFPYEVSRHGVANTRCMCPICDSIMKHRSLVLSSVASVPYMWCESCGTANYSAIASAHIKPIIRPYVFIMSYEEGLRRSLTEEENKQWL